MCPGGGHVIQCLCPIACIDRRDRIPQDEHLEAEPSRIENRLQHAVIRPDDSVAIRHRERATGQEIALHIDQQQCVVGTQERLLIGQAKTPTTGTRKLPAASPQTAGRI